MTIQDFTHPVLGIFTQFTNTQFPPHTFAVIFDRSDNGRIIDYRVIDYNGTYKAPDAPEHTHKEVLTDQGILIPITREAAQKMIDGIHGIRRGLMADPKIQEYYYSPSLLQRSRTQEAKGRKATNCTHYIMQLAMAAGVDLERLDYSCKYMDKVHELTDMITENMQTERLDVSTASASRDNEPTDIRHCMKPLEEKMYSFYWQADKDLPLLDVLNALPPHCMETLAEKSAPLIATLTAKKAALGTMPQPIGAWAARITREENATEIGG